MTHVIQGILLVIATPVTIWGFGGYVKTWKGEY